MTSDCAPCGDCLTVESAPDFRASAKVCVCVCRFFGGKYLCNFLNVFFFEISFENIDGFGFVVVCLALLDKNDNILYLFPCSEFHSLSDTHVRLYHFNFCFLFNSVLVSRKSSVWKMWFFKINKRRIDQRYTTKIVLFNFTPNENIQLISGLPENWPRIRFCTFSTHEKNLERGKLYAHLSRTYLFIISYSPRLLDNTYQSFQLLRFRRFLLSYLLLFIKCTHIAVILRFTSFSSQFFCIFVVPSPSISLFRRFYCYCLWCSVCPLCVDYDYRRVVWTTKIFFTYVINIFFRRVLHWFASLHTRARTHTLPFGICVCVCVSYPFLCMTFII